MGVRISYNYIKDGKRPEEVLTEYYDLLRERIYEWHDESLAIHSKLRYSEKVIDFIVLHDELPAIANLEQELLDVLMSNLAEVIWLSDRKPKPLKSIGAEVHPRRYIASTELIRELTDEKTKQLWNYLLVGRSLKDDMPFTIFSDQYRVGFWRREECLYLYQSLKDNFGTVEQIRGRYWTAKEKQQLDDAIKEAERIDSYVSLSDHNPVSSGIEYVLEVLECVNGLDVDVVFEVG